MSIYERASTSQFTLRDIIEHRHEAAIDRLKHNMIHCDFMLPVSGCQLDIWHQLTCMKWLSRDDGGVTCQGCPALPAHTDSTPAKQNCEHVFLFQSFHHAIRPLAARLWLRSDFIVSPVQRSPHFGTDITPRRLQSSTTALRPRLRLLKVSSY
jgi:hypothetical protein